MMAVAPDPSTLTVLLSTNLADKDLADALEFLNRADCGSYLQRPDWPALCPPPARHRYVVLRAFAHNRLVGIALARLTWLGPGRFLATLRRGPVAESVDDLAAVVGAMAEKLRLIGVCTMVVNPRYSDEMALQAVTVLQGLGAVLLPGSEQALHRATLMVDLPQGPDSTAQLEASLKQRCRRQIRRAEAMGLTVRPVETLQEAMLYEPIMADFYTRRGLSRENLPSVATMFQMTQENGAFLLGWFEGRLICGHTVIADGNRAFWLTMASLNVNGDLPKNYLLIYKALQIVIAQGFTQYDMAGAQSLRSVAVPENDNGTDNAAQLREQFKLAFDPRHVELMPAMMLALRPVAHGVLYGLRRKLRSVAGRTK